MKTRIREGKRHDRVLLLDADEWNTIMVALEYLSCTTFVCAGEAAELWRQMQ